MKHSPLKEKSNRASQQAAALATAAQREAHVDDVQGAIDRFQQNMNASQGIQTAAAQFKGNVAETWHAETFNVNAVLNESSNRAQVLNSHELGSVDIKLSSGETASSKYYKTATASANQQAKTLGDAYREYQRKGGNLSFEEYATQHGYSPNVGAALYEGQVRLVPAEQLKEVQETLKAQIDEALADGRTEDAARLQETFDKVSDRLRDAKGNESIPLTTEEATEIADQVKDGTFDPNKYDVSTEELFTNEVIFQKAIHAGISAAVLTTVIKVAPEIINSIKQLIDEGKIDPDQLKTVGFAAISGGAEGFLNGSVSATLTMACHSGRLGAFAKTIDSSAIASLTVIVIHTMEDAFAVAIGKKTQQELTARFMQESFTTSCAILCGTTLNMILPAFGYLLGSFAGSLAGSYLYSAAYDKAISFCVTSGWTFFGLVDQDYTLPDEMVKNLGIALFEPERCTYKKFKPRSFSVQRVTPKTLIPEKISFTVLRRGVIAPNRIAYSS